MIFCQKVGKRGVKHETFLMWNGIKSFQGKPFHFCHVNFFLVKAYFIPAFEKTGKQLISPPLPPTPRGGGALVENTALTRIDKSNKHNSNILRQLATKIHLLVPLIS